MEFIPILLTLLLYGFILYLEEVPMEDKIKEAIEAIRPSLQNDGGDISLERIDGKNVHVKLHGHCAGCPMSQITLSNGVERYLRDTVDPELVVINDDFIC